MAKNKAPLFVRVGNVLTTTLLNAGFSLVGPGLIIGKYPMYLFTVRGRKSGLPRTVPIAIIQHNGQRYLGSPFGIVDWVRNLRASGEAVLTRSRRSETVSAKELSPGEAAIILQEEARAGNPFIRPYGVTASSSMEDFEHAVLSHPVFLLERK